MVFSQTSLKTQSILKVVELERLQAGKNQQVNGWYGSKGFSIGGNTERLPPTPVATTSYSEVFLKSESAFASTMFHDSDFECFQDLDQWSSDLVKEGPALTTDSKKNNEENAYNIDTTYTPFSPQGWDVDANSPAAGPFLVTQNVNSNTNGVEYIENEILDTIDLELENKYHQELEWDLTSMPVVLGDLASEQMVDLNPVQGTGNVGFRNTQHLNQPPSNKMLPIDEEFDTKLNSVIPRQIQNNDVVISEYILNDEQEKGGVLQQTHKTGRRGAQLSLNTNIPTPWETDIISTPDVLRCVEQLEKEDLSSLTETTDAWLLNENGFESMDIVHNNITAPLDYEPITPKTESHLDSDIEDCKPRTRKRKRLDSEDSDETYMPEPKIKHSPRKYIKRKANVPIKDLISALESTQEIPRRRGRPPKRRDSTVSSTYSFDGSCSTVSPHENKYRELRDKNNEASKRSRMNRKLKDLQMEQMALDLEERNKQLKVRADILEEMTKKLREALLTTIIQK